jgi:hypothetical protein
MIDALKFEIKTDFIDRLLYSASISANPALIEKILKQVPTPEHLNTSKDGDSEALDALITSNAAEWWRSEFDTPRDERLLNCI